jgi:hypothetical protein
MKRHLSTRHGTAALEEFTKADEQLQHRACRPCAKAKQRCDGQGQPCDACRSKGRDCVYESRGNERALTSPLGHGELPEQVYVSVLGGVQSRSDLFDESYIEPSASIADPITHLANDLAPELNDAHNAENHNLDSSLSLLHPSNLELQIPPAWEEHEIHKNNPFLPAVFSPGLDWMLGDEGWSLEDAVLGDYQQIPGSNVQEEDEQDILLSEHVQHVGTLRTQTYSRILEFAEEYLPHHSESASDLPSLGHFDVYLQLYFEHFHPRMPFLHVPTFDVGEQAWCIVLAAATTGCEYSTASHQGMHLAVLRQLGHLMIENDVRRSPCCGP